MFSSIPYQEEKSPGTASSGAQGARWTSPVPHRIRTRMKPQLDDAQRSLNENEKPGGEKEIETRNDEPSQQTRRRRERSQNNLLPGHKTHRSSWSLRTRAPRRKHDENSPLVKHTPSPWTLLTSEAGRTSALLPSDLSDDFLKEQLHNIPNVFADMVSIGSSGSRYGKTFAMNLMSSIIVSPTLLHSMLFAEFLHDRVQQEWTQAQPIEGEVGARAVMHVNRETSGTRSAISEHHIWSVVVLAYSGRVAQLRSDMRMEVVVIHVIGLIKMIELIGGLHKIKTPGMAQLISLHGLLYPLLIRSPVTISAGIIGACRTIQKPIFPFIPHTETFMLEGELSVTTSECETAAANLGPLGTGFWKVWDTASSPLMHDLCRVIRQACYSTVVVENYIQGRWTQRTAPEIIDQRNYVQHTLLSLPTSQDLTRRGIEVGDLHYESCRLATIIYSFLIIFPIPPVVGPFETLTRRLRQELETTSHEGLEQPRLEMHLWILVMGAIASLGLSDRPWFLPRIMTLSQALGLHEWKDLKRLLRSFLWHYSTSDVDGIDIWNEMQELLLFKGKMMI